MRMAHYERLEGSGRLSETEAASITKGVLVETKDSNAIVTGVPVAELCVVAPLKERSKRRSFSELSQTEEPVQIKGTTLSFKLVSARRRPIEHILCRMLKVEFTASFLANGRTRHSHRPSGTYRVAGRCVFVKDAENIVLEFPKHTLEAGDTFTATGGLKFVITHVSSELSS